LKFSIKQKIEDLKEDLLQIYFNDRSEWRLWLEKNHALSKGIWIIFYKKHSGKPSVPYEDAVQEALCFGWIDSTIKRLDKDRYLQKFTPRKDDSVWSESNKKRVEPLIDENIMTEAGLQKINMAKENGKWNEGTVAEQEFILSDEIYELIRSNHKALAFYKSLPPGLTRLYTTWIMSARKEETRESRARKLILSLQKGEKLRFI
jgi:uncharacterized protein YdeI (YjbR/CyaY-like superfamily)